MSTIADRIEAVATGQRPDSTALSEAVRIDWISARDKDVIRRIMYGDERDDDWLNLHDIANRIRDLEQ